MTERAASSPPLWLQDQWDAADARASRWRVRGLVLAAALWVFPSLFVWFLLVTSLTGWNGENGFEGVLDGSADGLATFTLALIIELAAAGGLVLTARWALAAGRAAWVVGLGATTWAQVLATVAALV